MTKMAEGESMLDKLRQCLGGPWPEPGDLHPRVTSVVQHQGYRVEAVEYEAEPGDRVPAFVLVPDGVNAQHPAAAVAVWHQHAGQYHLGKSEPAGIAGNPMHHTGVSLVKAGYVVICPDALCFEDRAKPNLHGGNDLSWRERFEFLRYVVAGKCLAWKNILDMRRAIDYLVSRPEVRSESIGCYGHSMGSTHAYLVAPFEPRIKAVVCNACMPTYAAIEHHRLLHCFPNFVPGWQQHGDVPDIVSLIAPRALHMNFGATDDGSPIEFVRAGLASIARAYERAGAADRFTSYIEPGVGHVLSPQMAQHMLQTFQRHLKG